jgi:hypothetical protein
MRADNSRGGLFTHAMLPQYHALYVTPIDWEMDIYLRSTIFDEAEFFLSCHESPFIAWKRASFA